jgi:hypothetical protein
LESSRRGGDYGYNNSILTPSVQKVPFLPKMKIFNNGDGAN